MNGSQYPAALERYAELGVDTEAALSRLASVSISLHCWQGDDVRGFEALEGGLGGGLAATGNYPGKARTPDELRGDAEQAFACIPGRHRFNLHASYGEFGRTRVERNEIGPEHFAGWIEWARGLGVGLDFNPTLFSHPLVSDYVALPTLDPGIRQFWIDPGNR